jgi:hypothetical protein
MSKEAQGTVRSIIMAADTLPIDILCGHPALPTAVHGMLLWAAYDAAVCVRKEDEGGAEAGCGSFDGANMFTHKMFGLLNAVPLLS